MALLNVSMLCFIMLGIELFIVLLGVVMLSVVMLNVVAPLCVNEIVGIFFE
jgi:hypothetical protein